ncbi:tetratricopeptide repeat protein [Algibacter mikhailovii]|uniref:tetratricopeptide repeat protein n=1 Tax=Algibacter mikhailovii TaxID=425498 RepID=UPI002494A532|nr:tetratricopeptide repeat protein [Algibacter mikhailovii]
MNRPLIIVLYFLAPFIVSAQDKIPFIDYEQVSKEVTEASEANDYKKTIQLLNKINKNDSTYCSVLISKSYYLINSEKYEESIEVADEGLSLNCYDSNLSFYINKGLATSYLEKYEDAIKIYNNGLKTYPKNYLLWYNKGVALEELNRVDAAVEAYQKSITLNPRYAKPHLRLGNLCYKQELLSQALMCYNMYLLLTYNEDNAFNTLKSLNNLVSEKNENEANSDLQISEDDEAFEDIDLILSNKITLNKNYETGNKINISLTKQNHGLLAQLEDFEGHGGFWDKKYIPLYKWITENDLFDDFTYTLSYSIQNEKYTKIIKQNEKEILSFVTIFYDKWCDILKKNNIPFDGEKQNVFYDYYNGYVQGIGKKNNEIAVGKWEFYNQNGQLISHGAYNDKEERTGKWTWFHKNGSIKETAFYKDGVLQGENLQFHENGKPYVISNYSNNKLNGEYKYFNNKGALIQKKHYKDGELNDLYESFFSVGKDLLEYHIPYKNGLVENLATEYYANGSVYAEIPFTNGKRNGIEKQYYWNKNLSSEINYENGDLNGPYQSFYSNGNTIEIGQSLDNFYNGPWKSFYWNGTLQAEFSYDKGKIDGEYKYYDTDGKPYYKYIYRKGEIIEYRYYDKEGNIISEGRKKGGEFQFKGHYPNGNVSSIGLYDIKGGKEGFWQFFSKNGALTSEGYYSDNKQINEHLTFYNNGKIESKGYYENDQLSGYYAEYYKSGQLRRQGWNKDGKAQGEWHSYYIDGTLETINFYHKDQLHGEQKYYSVSGKLGQTFQYKFGELLTETYLDIHGNALGTIDYNTEKNNFTLEYLYKNNKISTKIKYVNGVKHGDYRSFDFYGNKQITGQYINDVKDGKWTWYYEKGGIESTRNYLNGNLNGESIDYYENGNIEAKSFYDYGKSTSTDITYHQNGKKSRVTEYNNDLVHGKMIFYDDSEKLQLIRFYNHGTLIGFSYLDKSSKELPLIPLENETGKIKSYFDNGNLARELEFNKGDLTNTYRKFYYSGQLESKITFIDNEIDGATLEYYPNGNLKSEKNYQMGVLQGITKNYYENGKLKNETKYRNGAKTGEANYYSLKGNLERKEFYFNGDVYEYESY